MTTSSPTPTNHDIDALLPAEIAEKAEAVGVQKTKLDVLSLMALAVRAGAFIALGAMFATTVLAGADGVLPFGLSRLFAGIAFCLGLILVILGGAELFTGNTLMIMAWAAGKVRLREMFCGLGSSFTSATLLARPGLRCSCSSRGSTCPGTAPSQVSPSSSRSTRQLCRSVTLSFLASYVTSWCASRCGSLSARVQRATRCSPCFPRVGLRRGWLRALSRQHVPHTPRLVRESVGAKRIVGSHWNKLR